MAVTNPLLSEFQGGQMTDLPAYPGGVDLTALFEVVSPGTAAAGVNYSISTSKLAILINAATFGAPTFVTSGSIYNSVATDTRILVEKTISSPTTINLLASTSYVMPILIKDLKGDADLFPITVNFSGSYDGVVSPLTITTQFGWIWFNPLASGNWYAT